MVRVETNLTISVPASVLWQIMMEVDKYPQWYSVKLEASGTPRLGARLRFRVKAMDGSPRQLSFAATVVGLCPSGSSFGRAGCSRFWWVETFAIILMYSPP